MQQQAAAAVAAAAAEIKCCSRTPCCSKVGLNRGPWSPDEDLLLTKYIQTFGEGRWRTLPKKAGLKRCGKSCRLRWMNYLRPDVKRGYISPEEEDLILRLHRLLGNRWSLIAGRIPGRTDNEIKNYWNTHLKKKLLSQGIDPGTHKPLAADSLLEKPSSNGSSKGRPKASSSSSEREKQQHQQSKSDAVLDQQIHPSVTCSSSPHEDLSQQQQFRGCDFASVNETKQTHHYHHGINHDCEDSSSCFQDKPRTAFDDFPVLQPSAAADTNPTPNVNSFPDLNCHQSPQQQPETTTVHAQLKPQLLLLKNTAAATAGSSVSAYEHHHTNNNHHLAIPFLLQDLFTSAAASPPVPLDNSSTSSDRLLSRLHHQQPPFQHLHFPHSFLNAIHSNETDDALKHSYTTNPHAAASLLSMDQSHSNPAFLEMLPPLSVPHHHQNHHHHDSMMSLQQQQQPLSGKNMEMDTSGFDQSILQRLNKAHEASFFTADVSNLLMMNNNDRRNNSSSIDFNLGYVHQHQGLFDININASGNAVVASSIGSSVVSNNPSHLHESVNNLSCDSWMLSHCHPQV